jgi:hypothetical protein
LGGRVVHKFGRLGGGTSAEILLEAVLGQLGVVLRFEARVFSGQFAVLADVLANAEAGFGVFLQNVPIVGLFFHLVALIFDAKFLLLAALRFEAILLPAPFGS